MLKLSFRWVLILLFSGMSLKMSAQHDHHDHSHQSSKKQDSLAPQSKDTTGHGMHEHGEHEHSAMQMTHAFSRNLPMTRNGSGTSWQPDHTPMYGYMFHQNDWMFMVHGQAYLRYNKQDLLDKGSRGDSKFDAPNMVMLMGQRPVGKKGLFHFNTMFSLDPVTVGGNGYPLLFQTGETYKGQPLVDRQHPHDLFSELSVSYAHALSKSSDLFIYVGYPGEPAIGPSAYVHRPSGFFNPDAPLTHHWVDATHITFGVITAGYRFRNLKLEASSFTGREPDEERYGFDKPRFDSWSGRLSWNPSPSLATQVSHARINAPETLHPGEDVQRTTASFTYSRRGFGESFYNLTGLWGMNKKSGHHGEHGLLVEGDRSVRRTHMYARYEWVQKSLEELNLDEQEYGHDAVFPVHSFTFGTAYDLFTFGQTKIAVGGQLSLYNPDQRLADLYGDNPLSGQVYLRIYPRAMGRQEGKLFLPY